MQLRQPRLSEVVADILRGRILKGALKDQDALPKQEDLLEEFKISKPSLREALRILEAEGLIAVRRGNRGGAIVRVPKAENVAYMIGLVLQHRKVELADVAQALTELEPMCARLSATRPDRASTVLPELYEVHEAMKGAVDDDLEFTHLGRRFHEGLVSNCGNETMILVVGALTSLWTAQEEAWAERAAEAGDFPPRKDRLAGIRAHERLIQLIEKGDGEGVEKIARRHLESAQLYTLSGNGHLQIVGTSHPWRPNSS